MASIALITPTIGRKSLEQSVIRAHELLLPEDKHFVIFDGTQEPKWHIRPEHLPTLPLLHTSSLSVLWSVSGNAQRDLAIRLALALPAPPAYLVFCDDDDCVLKEGIDFIHNMEPDGKMHCLLSLHRGQRVGFSHSLELGHVAGGRLCVPLVPDMPKWTSQNVREADFFFANACKRKFGPPVWHDIPLLELNFA